MKRVGFFLLLLISGPVSAVTMELQPDHLEVRVATEADSGGTPYALELMYKGDLIYKYSHSIFATINTYKHIVLSKVEKAIDSKGVLVLNTHNIPANAEWLMISNQATIDELLPRLKDLESRLERLEKR